MKKLILLSSALLTITSMANAGTRNGTCQKEEARKLAYSLIQSNFSTNIPGTIEMKIVSLSGSITDKSDNTSTDENGAIVRKFFYYAMVQSTADQFQIVQQPMVGYVQVGTKDGKCVIQATEGSNVVSVDLNGNESN